MINNLEKINILDQMIANYEMHINALSEAINEGATSNKPITLEESMLNLIKMKEALENEKMALSNQE